MMGDSQKIYVVYEVGEYGLDMDIKYAGASWEKADSYKPSRTWRVVIQTWAQGRLIHSEHRPRIKEEHHGR